jgi:predicted Zn-dependent protease
VTPLATRIRDLLARTGKPPKRESEAARHARESGCLIVGRRDCEAVLALIDAATATEPIGFNKGYRRLMEAVAALEE